MSLIEIKVPQLSESVAEATLLQWKKKVGESVARDEILIEIETDKVVLEVPAPDAGVLTSIEMQDGATVVSDQLIAKLDTSAKPATAAPSPAASPVAASPVAASPVAASPVAPAPATTATPASGPVAGGKASGVAMPAAAKILADQGRDTKGIEGTGRDGRVTKGDALQALATAPVSPPPAAALRPTLPEVKAPISNDKLLQGRTEQRVPMSRLRQRIAERLLQSQSMAAILTTFNEVNMQPVMDLRNRYKDRFEKEHNVKLGFMSFFVKAAVYALKKYPVVNASVDGTDIVYHGYFDVGIAVSSPRGLVVPILRNADQMSFADVERSIAEYANKAKEGKLTLEDLTGGTFSISNGGTFGSMLSTPIINPPQSAILGVHATKDRAVVENGQVVVRPMNYLAMSYDHRIIDGREAVMALVAMKDALEDPARLLLEL
jgi:2-oxoglutarate dehydrogenase E2 component (dihydrolipoamide succinyltransferase)